MSTRVMTWLEQAKHARTNPEAYLSIITADEYKALDPTVRRLRGYAAETERKRWERSAVRRQWLAVNADAECIRCGAKPVTADHITPIVRGGLSEDFNLQPLCGPCNSRKGSR